VSFAGAYCDLLIWALATIAWRVTEFSTGVSHIALIIMGTTVIRTLFNLNPLIKLDGYYLLSDYLEIPNLRDKAIGFLKRRVTNVTPRERRIYRFAGLRRWRRSRLDFPRYRGHAGGHQVAMQRGKGAQLTPLGHTLLWAEKRTEASLFPQLENIASELNIEIGRALRASSDRPSQCTEYGCGRRLPILDAQIRRRQRG
jgi:hypothetical protein